MSEPTLQQVMDRIAEWKQAWIDWQKNIYNEDIPKNPFFFRDQAVAYHQIIAKGSQLSPADQDVLEEEMKNIKRMISFPFESKPRQ